MHIFQMYVFISSKVINEILPVYLFIEIFILILYFLRQVFIFRAVLLLTLCQCAALRCYISWVGIIIKPSLYILKLVSSSLSHVHVIDPLCLFSHTAKKRIQCTVQQRLFYYLPWNIPIICSYFGAVVFTNVDITYCNRAMQHSVPVTIRGK